MSIWFRKWDMFDLHSRTYGITLLLFSMSLHCCKYRLKSHKSDACWPKISSDEMVEASMEGCTLHHTLKVEKWNECNRTITLWWDLIESRELMQNYAEQSVLTENYCLSIAQCECVLKIRCHVWNECNLLTNQLWGRYGNKPWPNWVADAEITLVSSMRVCNDEKTP